MKHRFQTAMTIIALVLPGITGNSQTQQVPPATTPSLITDTRVAPREGSLTGTLYVTINGREKKVSDEVDEAWIIRGGRQVVYSGMDGSGGFENEGQSLRIYDARTGKQRKILAEYYGVMEVKEVTTSQRKTALLVNMADGGLGASYLAVVDPDRGEVFFRRWVRVVGQKGDVIVMGHFKEDDWSELDANNNMTATPYKTERQNLNTILRRRVIVNKRDR